MQKRETKRPQAVIDLENLNVEICKAAGAGHPAITPEQANAYLQIMAERACEVKTAINKAKTSLLGLPRATSHHFIHGIECALDRALTRRVA